MLLDLRKNGFRKTFLEEGSSINRPPSFTGEFYELWKIRMKIFLESQGVEIWKSMKNGIFIRSIVVGGVNKPKPEDTWDEEDNKKFYMIKRPTTL